MMSRSPGSSHVLWLAHHMRGERDPVDAEGGSYCDCKELRLNSLVMNNVLLTFFK
jgi:hypothetical protein